MTRAFVSRVILDTRDKGKSILLITHNLERIMGDAFFRMYHNHPKGNEKKWSTLMWLEIHPVMTG